MSLPAFLAALIKKNNKDIEKVTFTDYIYFFPALLPVFYFSKSINLQLNQLYSVFYLPFRYGKNNFPLSTCKAGDKDF